MQMNKTDSHYFKFSQMVASAKAQKLGIDNTPPAEMVPAILWTLAGCDRIRSFLDHPVLINSGYRCEALNRAVKGSNTSQHMRGEAADIICPAYGSPKEVFDALRANQDILGIDQMILEATWVHVSFVAFPRLEALRFDGTRYVQI